MVRPHSKVMFVVQHLQITSYSGWFLSEFLFYFIFINLKYEFEIEGERGTLDPRHRIYLSYKVQMYWDFRIEPSHLGHGSLIIMICPCTTSMMHAYKS